MFDYACLRHIAIEEVQNYGKIVCIKNIFENGCWMDAYLLSYPLDPSLALSYKNHQKSLAYFSHSAPLILFFLLKEVKRGGAWHNAPLNMLLPRSLRLGACERIISLLKGGLHVYKRRSGYCG